MDIKMATSLIGNEWGNSDGFIWKLRVGSFDSEGLNRILSVLRSVKIDNPKCLDKDLVTVLWLIPLTIEWQKRRFEERGKDVKPLDEAGSLILNELYNILGVP